MPEPKLPYAEFVKKTSMFRDRLQKPGSTWQAVLAAYGDYASPQPGPQANERLFHALNDYFAKHGHSDWAKVDRDKESKGLLRRLHGELRGQVQLSTREDILNSRYGVLFVLSNVNIAVEFSAATFTAEMISHAGSVVGTGVGTRYGNLKNKDASQIAVNLLGQKTDANSITGHGATLVKGVGMVVDKALKPSTGPAFSMPTSERALEIAGRMLGDNLGPNVVLNGMAKTGVVLATGVALVGTALYDLLRKLWDTLKPVVKAGLEKIVSKQMVDPAWNYEKLAMVIGNLTKVILNFVAEAAVPFVAAGIDCATGAIKAADAVIDKIKLKMERGKFTLMPGHPQLMAQYIEDTTLSRFGKAMLETANGAASIVTQVFAPGLGQLVSAVTKAVAWGAGWIIKYMEHTRLKQFLSQARDMYKAERKRAEMAEWSAAMQKVATAAKSGPPAAAAAAPVRTTAPLIGRARSIATASPSSPPPLKRTAVTPLPEQNYVPPDPKSPFLNDVAAFTEFFVRGCKASPLVPMVILRSHICGSLMSFLKLTTFDGKLNDGAQFQFDAGERYFNRLKTLSLNYIQASGFNVHPVQGASQQAQQMVKMVLGQLPPRHVTLPSTRHVALS